MYLLVSPKNGTGDPIASIGEGIIMGEGASLFATEGTKEDSNTEVGVLEMVMGLSMMITAFPVGSAFCSPFPSFFFSS